MVVKGDRVFSFWPSLFEFIFPLLVKLAKGVRVVVTPPRIHTLAGVFSKRGIKISAQFEAFVHGLGASCCGLRLELGLPVVPRNRHYRC